MNKSSNRGALSHQRLLAGCLAIPLVLSACAPVAVPGQVDDATGQAVTTPAPVSNQPIAGYPVPETPRVLPPTDPGPVVTADPAEELRVADITQVSAAYGSERPYTLVDETVSNASGRTVIRATVVLNDRKIPLGEGMGSAIIVATSPEWVVWSYYTEAEVNPTAPEKDDMVGPSGLYALDVATSKTTLLEAGTHSGPPAYRISGDWLLLGDGDGAPGRPVTSNQPTDYNLRLRAFNLRTQKSITLTERLPFVWGSPPNAFFDGDASRVVWIEYDPTQKRHSILLYSFETGQATPLDVTLELPRWISLAEDFVVWQDTYWKGMSLSRQAGFTIPAGPRDYEWQGGTVVTATPGGVEWEIISADGKRLYFQAPIVPK